MAPRKKSVKQVEPVNFGELLDRPPYKAAYKGKPSISYFVEKYRSALNMIALVHERGARKYECYSWLTDPNASNSTVVENLDALFRHMGAHTMGKWQDVEDLPHIFHMACRAGMLITTFYRNSNPTPVMYADPRPYIDQSKKVCLGHHITHEELLVLTKEDHYRIPETKEELQGYIMNLLIAGVDHVDDKADCFGPHLFDRLFLAVLKYAQLSFTPEMKRILLECDLVIMDKEVIRDDIAAVV